MSTAAALSNLAKKRKIPTKTKTVKAISKPTSSDTDDNADDLESALNYNFEDASLDLADFSDDDTAMVVPASHLKKLNESAFLADDEEPSAKKLRLSKEAEIKAAREQKKAAEQKAENERNTKNRLQRGISSDPSLRYFNIPSEIPTVKDARQFFEYDLPITAFNRKKGKSKTVSGDSDAAVQKNPIDFKVTVGSVTRWRSLAKLAVRSFGPKTMEDLVREKLSAAIQERNARTSKAGKAELGSAANAAAEADLKGQIEREVAAAMSKVAETGTPSTRSAPVKLSRRQRKTMNKVTAGEEIWERPQIGLFAPGSHDIVPGIELCPAHHPSINTAINEISQVINTLQVTGFNDKTGAGQLRFIAMTVATNPAAPGSVTLAGTRLSPEDMKENSFKASLTQGKIQLTLVWNSRGSDAEKPKSFATPTIEKQLPQGEAALEYFATSDPTLEKVVKTLLQDRRKGVKAPSKQDKKNNKNKNAKKSSLPEDHWLWQSIHVHHQNSWSHTNAIFSHDPNSWQRVFGPEAVTEIMPMKYTKEATVLKAADSKDNDVKEVAIKESEDKSKVKKDNTYPIMPFPTPARPVLHFPPTVFRQANLEGFSRIVSAVRPWIPINSRVVELYGGVGTIGLNLVDRVQSIICSDENPNNAKCFLATASSLPLAMRAGRAIKYIPKNATGMVELGALHKSVLTTKDLFPSPEQLLKQQLALLSDDEESEEEETKMLDKKEVKNNREKRKLTVDNVEEDIEEFRARILDLSTADTMLLPPNVCIVDPPRKGLEPEILAALAIPKASVSTSNATAAVKNVMGIEGLKISGNGNKIASTKIQSQPLTATSHLERLIYVSCGFKALKRDAEQLATPQGGGWRIAHAEGHILFPGADHLETLVVFVR